ncbi:MAG: hypothetical protein M1365_14800, partial [Actinobacteria bacterium]|nr:hypothetical protein [Actinomycetota bacterium]
KIYDRVKKTLNCEETDRPPIYDNFRNDKVIEYFSGEKLTINQSKIVCIKAIDNSLDCIKQFLRFPQKRRVTRVKSFPFAYSINFSPEVSEELEFEVEYKRWSTWVYDKNPYDFDRIIKKAKRIIDSYNSWKNWNIKNLNNIIKDFKEKQSWFKNTVLLACISEVGLNATYDFLGGVEKFSYLLQDDNFTLMELFDTFYQINIEKIKSIPKGFNPVAAFVPEDIAYKNTTLFSPIFLKKEFFPRLKKIVEAYHDKDLKVIFHSDGNLWEIMDDLVNCEIDGLNPIETIAKMDLKKLRKKYPRLVMLGGIDCSELLPYADTGTIKNVTKKSIDDTKYGYFPGSTSEVHNEIPLVNYLSFYEEVVNYES